MTSLEAKLTKLQKLESSVSDLDWQVYKEEWKNSISILYNDIMLRFLNDYEDKGLMTFNIIPVARIETYIGEYVTATLEIMLINNKSLIIEPVSAVTSEYDGRLDFYLRGSIYKKVSIYRKFLNENKFVKNSKYEWIIAKSNNTKDHSKFSKIQIEKLIDEWLS